MQHEALLELITQEPLVIDGRSQRFFQAAITSLGTHERREELLASTANEVLASGENFWFDAQDWRSQYRPYNVQNGILQIPIQGVLLNRFPWQYGRMATGYKYIEMALKRGLDDPNVRGIALIIDSGGGEVAGCFELGDMIYEARSRKPIRSFAADHAYSAAYLLFSSSGKGNGSVTRSGGTGSVGVVTAHVSYEKYLEKVGMEITFVFAGDHKVDGNPYQALPAEVKERIQARINKIYGLFTSTVARNRGMDNADVVNTKALTYDAAESIEIGFADRVGALEDEMAIFVNDLETGDQFMSTTQPGVTGKKDGDDGNSVSAETHASAVAAAKAEGTTEGAKAEKARISGIISCESAKERPAAALHTALHSDMTVEAANSFLAGFPVEKKAEATQQTNGKTGTTMFQQAMNQSQNPDIQAVDQQQEGDGTQPTAADKANAILADYSAQSGHGRKKTKAA